jgi:hypothetical protein
MQNASIERYFIRSDKLSFNSVKFSIEKKVEPKKGKLKRTKDNQHSINEVVPNDGVTNTPACA